MTFGEMEAAWLAERGWTVGSIIPSALTPEQRAAVPTPYVAPEHWELREWTQAYPVAACPSCGSTLKIDAAYSTLRGCLDPDPRADSNRFTAEARCDWRACDDPGLTLVCGWQGTLVWYPSNGTYRVER